MNKDEIRQYIYNLGFAKEDVDPAFLKAVMPSLLDEQGNPLVQVREVSAQEANEINADPNLAGVRHIAIALLDKASGLPVFDFKEIDSLAQSIGMTKLMPIVQQARKLAKPYTPKQAEGNSDATQGSDSNTN